MSYSDDHFGTGRPALSSRSWEASLEARDDARADAYWGSGMTAQEEREQEDAEELERLDPACVGCEDRGNGIMAAHVGPRGTDLYCRECETKD